MIHREKLNNNYSWILVVATLIIWQGCSGVQNTTTGNQGVEIKPPLVVAAGVDSTIATLADSLADDAFVPLEDEEEAEVLRLEAIQIYEESDSLWKFLQASREETQVTEADSINAIEQFNEGAIALIALQNLDSLGLIQQQDSLLSRAQLFLEHAIKKNPFDVQSRYYLAYIYQQRAGRFLQLEDYNAAAEILERLVRTEKGEHIIFSALGNTYIQLGNWTNAYYYYNQAEKVIIGTDYETPIDSLSLFDYVYNQGYAQIQARQAPEALHHLNRSLELNPPAESVAAVNTWIEFVNWDDGNINASFAKDSLENLAIQGQSQQAESGYFKLAENTKTDRARRQTLTLLSVLQFQQGKQAEAVTRLQNLTKEIIAEGVEGNSADPIYGDTFYNYGVICLQMGLDHLRISRRQALQYFIQSADFSWERQSRANLEIAKLIRNNVDSALPYATLAEENITQLEPQDRKELYRLLALMHRRKGNLDLARTYFNRFKGI